MNTPAPQARLLPALGLTGAARSGLPQSTRPSAHHRLSTQERTRQRNTRGHGTAPGAWRVAPGTAWTPPSAAAAAYLQWQRRARCSSNSPSDIDTPRNRAQPWPAWSLSRCFACVGAHVWQRKAHTWGCAHGALHVSIWPAHAEAAAREHWDHRVSTNMPDCCAFHTGPESTVRAAVRLGVSTRPPRKQLIEHVASPARALMTRRTELNTDCHTDACLHTGCAGSQKASHRSSCNCTSTRLVVFASAPEGSDKHDRTRPAHLPCLLLGWPLPQFPRRPPARARAHAHTNSAARHQHHQRCTCWRPALGCAAGVAVEAATLLAAALRQDAEITCLIASVHRLSAMEARSPSTHAAQRPMSLHVPGECPRRPRAAMVRRSRPRRLSSLRRHPRRHSGAVNAPALETCLRLTRGPTGSAHKGLPKSTAASAHYLPPVHSDTATAL